MAPTADEVLIVLNGLEAVNLTDLEFVVITAPAAEHWSNSLQRFVDKPSWWPFEPYEVLVVNAGGREPFGQGRKPSKWGVTAEYFPTFAEAMGRLNEVKPSTEEQSNG